MRSLRPRNQWLLGAAVAAYVGAAVGALAAVLWGSLPPDSRDAVAGQAVGLLILGGLVLAGLIALVAAIVGRYSKAVRRLTTETTLLVGANPDHRVDRSGPTEVAELAAAVDALAERRRSAERAVGEQIAAAGASLEEERNRLAALMAELGAAVIVCTAEGTILLYNAAAKAVLGDDVALGLGRSVFGIVDRNLLAHAADRFGDSSRSHIATTLHGDHLLQAQVAPARAPGGAITGFVLLLEDLTDRMTVGSRRDALLRDVTEGTRAALGSIQAAIETVVDYPDMDAADRAQFLGIVREESRRLGQRVQGWATDLGEHFGVDWARAEMSVADLVAVAGQALTRDAGMGARIDREPAADTLWVKVDSLAVTRVLTHLAARLREDCGAAALTLTTARTGAHVRVDLAWTGRLPPPETFAAWLDQPLAGLAASSAREVVARHGGEVWSGQSDRSGPCLSLLLPVIQSRSTPPAPAPTALPSRPEFYDFGLDDRGAQPSAEHDRDLGELSYTVFDTETTGLDAAGGDRIVSVGAVRVVNGRLLRNETFERLVNPERSVPAASTAVHGITAAMVTGQPTSRTVLPAFARFAADTVLVGHNVGFDMQFLRLEEPRTGVAFTQPVLDTLLLDAVAHPDHDEHSLEAIAGRLGVAVIGRHTALGDALVTGEVFLGLVAVLRLRGVTTLGEALAASRETMQARIDRRHYGS